MNNVTIFNNEAFGQLRTIEKDGEIWFVGKDVATMLGYRDTINAIKSHISEEDKMGWQITTPSRGTQTVNIINESGLYSLVFASKLPAAKEFAHWVTSDVLPSIRKTGKYEVQQRPYEPTDYDLRKLALEEKKLEKEKTELLLRIADRVSNELYKSTLESLAVTALTGNEYLPLPKVEEKYYTTEDLSKILSERFNTKVSGAIIGRLANQHNLKTDKYAIKVWNKARGCERQVESYRYKEAVIAPLCAVYEVYLQTRKSRGGNKK